MERRFSRGIYHKQDNSSSMESGENQVKVSSTTIFDLPFEDIVLTHIAVYLEDEDLLAMWKASDGSQAFRELAEGMIGAKKEIVINDLYVENGLYRLFVKNCRKLRSILVHNISLEFCQDGSLTELMTENPLLYEIKIYCYFARLDYIFLLVTACKNLTHLQLIGGLCEPPMDELPEAFTKSKILLRRVHLSRLCGITEEALVAFFAEQPSLRNIILDNLEINVRSTLHAIGRTCRELERIIVNDCDGVDDDVVREIAENCPKLLLFGKNGNPLPGIPH